jgi:hypothetical protein
MNMEKAVLTRGREVREDLSVRYRRWSVHLPGDVIVAFSPLVFFAFFAASREQLRGLR